MNSAILYLDCDGVILDTIDEAYCMMKELGLDTSDQILVNKFFRMVDWNILILRAGILKDSISKIKKIITSATFKDVVILTKISGNLNEESVKRTLFNKLLPGVRVITVNFNDNKDEVVDPINNILVEDTLSNALRWRNAGGIGLYFVKENPDFLNDEIADLSEITSAFGVQKVLKRI